MTATHDIRNVQDASETSETSVLESRPGSYGSQSLLTAAALAAPVLFLLLMGYGRRWISDDGFISLRIARNALDGYGPVYNIGERVEAHTNPLWVALLTLWGVSGASLERGAVWLGLSFSITGLVGAIAGSRLLMRRMQAGQNAASSGFLVPFGAIVFVSLPVVWDFTTSGLETSLAFGWLGVCFWMLARVSALDLPRSDAHWSMTALLFGLGPLIRPDLAIFSAGFLLSLLILRVLRFHRPKTLCSAVDLASLVMFAAVVPVSYQIVRMGYFALLTPNTALAKEAGMTNWDQGWLYLADLLETYHLWIPLLLVLGVWTATVLRSRRRDGLVLTVSLAPVASAVIHGLYVVRVGGDFMHGRFLLPTLFALLLPVAVIRLSYSDRQTFRPILSTAALALILVWAVASALWMRPSYGHSINPHGIADERAVYVYDARHENPVMLEDYADFRRSWLDDGLALRARAAEYPRVFLYEPVESSGNDLNELPLRPDVHPEIGLASYGLNIGILGFAAGPQVHVVDHFGLSDPIGSRMMVEERGRPGHEKALPMPWAIARYSDPSADDADSPDVAAAREALGCGPLPDLFQAIEEPLTMRRFLENIRLAPTLYDLRIPPHPIEARDTLCGPDS